MGSGIAAHLANIGFNVTLLDLTTHSVHACFDRAKSAKPPHFFVKGTADKIRLGSIEENLDWVKGADWVCEAIVEKLDAKRSLYEKLEALVDEDALLSTNTSGLEISLLVKDRSDSFKRRFFGTHFFNPPRYLKLLELIESGFNLDEDSAAVLEFLEQRVARRVVPALDTPGFIANRYGMWSMYQATHIAEKLQLSPEQVDLITGPFLGRPRSGSFRLNDIVGLDIMQDIARNQMARCPEDPYIGTLVNPKSVDYLLSQGNIGDKAGKGFYDKIGRDYLTFDLITHAYRQRIEPNLPTVTDNLRKPLAERLKLGLAAKDEVGEFMRLYLLPALRYADYLKGSICHSIQGFDRVMQWGFGWEAGPFEMIDMIGSANVLGANKQYYSAAGQLKPDESDHFLIVKEPEF
ncbi:MAG: 3-hydroxyacyl-CoA dehydrogenase, partial [Armatimonadetes bacterium Cent15-Ar3]